jgi:flavodoxin
VDLKGKKVLIVSLGDHRYHYTCGSADHMKEFVESHGGVVVEPILKIVNEPYGQEKTVTDWARQVSATLS